MRLLMEGGELEGTRGSVGEGLVEKRWDWRGETGSVKAGEGEGEQW